MYATNVEGTRNVIEAAGLAGCQRIVYTSTVGCIGLTQLVNGGAVPADEFETVPETQLTNHYKRSKWQAEEVAAKLARKGLPVIIVNPTAPIGPRDVKPTPTGQIIVDFLNRKMPAYLDTGIELGPRPRRGRRAHSRGGKGTFRRALHPGQRGGQLDDA